MGHTDSLRGVGQSVNQRVPAGGVDRLRQSYIIGTPNLDFGVLCIEYEILSKNRLLVYDEIRCHLRIKYAIHIQKFDQA